MKSLLFRRVLTAMVLCLLTALGFAAEPAAGCVDGISCERVSVRLTDTRSTIYYPLSDAPTASEPWFLVLRAKPVAARSVAISNVNRQFGPRLVQSGNSDVFLAQIVLIPLGLGVVLLATRKWKPSVWQLLGVLLTTAVLVAIFFPVFAQSKSSAKSAVPYPIYEIPGSSVPILVLNSKMPGSVESQLEKAHVSMPSTRVDEIREAIAGGQTVVVANPLAVAKSSERNPEPVAVAVDLAGPATEVSLPHVGRVASIRPVDIAVESDRPVRAVGSTALSVNRLRSDVMHGVLTHAKLITRSVGDGTRGVVGLEAFGAGIGSRRIVREELLGQESWLFGAAKMMVMAFFLALGLGRTRLSTPTVVGTVSLVLAVGTGLLAMKNRSEYVPWRPGEMIQRNLPT